MDNTKETKDYLFYKPTYKLKYIYIQIHIRYSKYSYLFLLTWFPKKHFSSDKLLKYANGEYYFKKGKSLDSLNTMGNKHEVTGPR